MWITFFVHFFIKNNDGLFYNLLTLKRESIMVATLTEITKLWSKTLKRIDQKLGGDPSFDAFFANSFVYELSGNTLIVVVQGLVAKNEVGVKNKQLVLDTLNEFVDDELELEVITQEELNNKRKSTKSENVVIRPQNQYFKDADVRSDLTFSNFVVGESNREAHKAAMYVARNGGNLFNPLFIYSHSGLGKTHLLHAIGNEIRATRIPNAKIYYIAANNFVEEYIEFVKAEKDSQNLKAVFNDVDVLLFDDVQLLTGKVKTQEMFFAIYQAMINAGKRIILTSDKQPNELKGLEERLVTRFAQGLTVKISEPDIETSVEILKQKIKQSGMDLNRFDDNVIYFLAEKYSKNVRELEGALSKLMFNCLDLLDNERVTMDFVIKSIGYLKGGKNIATQLNEQKIVNIVADYYNLTPSQITGKDRTGQIVLARHIAMYLIRKHLDIPLKKVGEMFGGKDHTTVMSAITKVDKELKTNTQLQSAITDLEKKIKE